MRLANRQNAALLQPFTTALPNFAGTLKLANAGGLQGSAACGGSTMMLGHLPNWHARGNILTTEHDWITNEPVS
jgi:hypothetical protein